MVAAVITVVLAHSGVAHSGSHASGEGVSERLQRPYNLLQARDVPGVPLPSRPPGSPLLPSCETTLRS